MNKKIKSPIDSVIARSPKGDVAIFLKRLLRFARNDTKGQTALILILLTAAALIFFAITANWGRIAQTKALVTTAAYQSAALLASDGASYGEQEKQTYLKDKNKFSEHTSVLEALFSLVVAIVIAIIAVASGQVELLSFEAAMLATSIVMSVVNVVLQVAVVQPMITSMWNQSQKNQPIPQQFYEGGVLAALESSVTDRVNVTDYLDWNGNGQYGLNTHNLPIDQIGRFSVFYGDRLKMINLVQPPNPNITCFYNALNELMNDETCSQNATDVSICGATANPACSKLSCGSDLACGVKIPINCADGSLCSSGVCANGASCGGFQLNDACLSGSNTGDAKYTPYCDLCCQPLQYDGKTLRPSSCPADVNTECGTNNPYGSSYPLIYDPAFQNYANGISFLAQFGRDQQMAPFTSLTPETIIPSSVYFPNGVFPYFWLMKDFSPEVDAIDPTNAANYSSTSWDHWCVPGTYSGGTVNSTGTVNGFSDLTQLSLGYTCVGKDCCVNHVDNSDTSTTQVKSSPITINLRTGPIVNITSPANNSSFLVGTDVPGTVTATDAGGTISSVYVEFQEYIPGSTNQEDINPTSSSPPNYNFDFSSATIGVHKFSAYAVDGNGVVGNSPTFTVTVYFQITGPTGSIVHGSPATITTNLPSGFQGTVTFYNFGSPLGTVTNSTSFSWTPTVSGTYSLTAKATDSNSTLSYTTPVAVTGNIT